MVIAGLHRRALASTQQGRARRCSTMNASVQTGRAALLLSSTLDRRAGFTRCLGPQTEHISTFLIGEQNLAMLINRVGAIFVRGDDLAGSRGDSADHLVMG